MKAKIAFMMALALLTAGVAWADPKLSSLNGTSWSVTVNPDGMAKEKGEKDFHETLIFVDDHLATQEGPKVGFATVPYTASRSGEKDWSFTAEQTSASQGSYVWSGTVHDDDVRGKLVWTKSDRSVLTYTFKGGKKK